MEYFVFILELIGTAAFAVSGATVGAKRSMDIFGVCVLALTTACGGGLIRDVILGKLPPSMFCEPIYALGAIAVGIIVFAVMYSKVRLGGKKQLDFLLLVTDSAGLGIFTVSGVNAAMAAGYGDSVFFTVFLGVLTGVGGGLMRDVMAQMPPYIFTKHIYACASIIGGLVCCLLRDAVGINAAMLAGCALVVAIRLISARCELSLPKIKNIK